MSAFHTHLDESRSLSPYASTMQDLATWSQRVFALVIDWVVIGVVALVVVMITTLVTFTPTATPTSVPTTASSSSGIFTGHGIYWYEVFGIGIASIMYFAILDGGRQTAGKRMLGIAVRDQATGRPIGVPRALLRWMIFVILWGVFIPGVLNALSPSWDRRRQAWHDRGVGSIVVEVD